MYLDNLILSSPVEGQILDHRRPVPGLTLERSLMWNVEQRPRLDYAITGDDGRFTFPEVRASYDFGWLSKYLHQPTVSQSIYVKTPERDLLAFANTRSSYRPMAETGFPVVSMVCDLKTVNPINEVVWKLACVLEKKGAFGRE